MGSAKTMNLLAVAHNYEQQGKRVKLLKPSVDDRFGSDLIRSRTGLERQADLCVKDDTFLDYGFFAGIDCIIVDECQFLSEFVIHQLRNITVDLDIPVICYGLRTNFMTRLFEGSRRLMEIADSIEEVKTTCAFCNRKAVFNIKLRQGQACTAGDEIELGAEELYQPTCCRCFEKLTGSNNPLRNNGSRVELWLVRHGETNENAAGVLSGQIDARLSPRGIEQAKALKPKLANIPFDAVYSSSLNRAIDTAHYAGKEPVPVDDLREFCFGDYDGKSIRSLPQAWVKALYDFTEFETPNGENIEMVTKRVTGFVNSLAAGRYLIFAHGGVIRTIVRQFGVDRFLQNGTVLIVDWTHGMITGMIEP